MWRGRAGTVSGLFLASLEDIESLQSQQGFLQMLKKEFPQVPSVWLPSINEQLQV